jgi:hypothetical protein
MIRRQELLAYLVGAGVAGTLLVGPYVLRTAVVLWLPAAEIARPPFFLLPIMWGLWNFLWVRVRPWSDIGLWGASLGIVGGLLVNLLFVAQRVWFPAALLLPFFLPFLYFLLWRLIVGPLNDALGVTGERARA